MQQRTDSQTNNGADGQPLQGRVALVTGAGQGIGRGIALELAAAGAAVALAGRTTGKLDAVAGEIHDQGGRAVTVTIDVAGPAAGSAVAETVRQLGGLDILVNNAQEFCFGPLLHIDADQVEAGWRSGPLAALALMRAAHPHLTGGGAVVNVTSGAAHADDLAGVGVYAAVKAALGSLSRAAAQEWGGDGIRVNALVPFAVTPSLQAMVGESEEAIAMLGGQVPLGRVGDARADVGRAVAWLVGPDAAYITGATLQVDGGGAWLR